MIKYSQKTWVEVSRQALAHNVKQFQRMLKGKTMLMAVVKANAYGHCAAQVVPVVLAAGANWLAVDSIDEALSIDALRKRTPLLILGYTLENRLTEAVQRGFRLTVYNRETIRALGRITDRLKKPAYLHLKCETGTSRQGVLFKELVPIAKLIGKYKYLVLEGLSTHYANIEDTTNHSYAARQFSQFQRMVAALEAIGINVPLKHASCTAAAMLFPETHFNIARVGIGLYGLWPSHETFVSMHERNRTVVLEPALTWKTRVAQVKSLPRGTPVSYGITEKLSRNSKIAVLPIGYWDGYDRKLSSSGIVLIHGKRCRIIGRICMNMCMVDVTDVPGVKPEDEVVLLGTQGREVVTADELARKLNTINYEIVARINPTIARILM